MRPAVLSLAVLAAFSSGCTAFLPGGAGQADAGYPESFLLQQEDAPRGYTLVERDDEMWEMVAGVGMARNPGRLSPASDFFEALPGALEAWAAVYRNADDEGMVSLAVRFDSLSAARRMLTEGDSPCAPGQADPIHVLGDGARIAILTGDVAGAVSTATAAVRRSSGGIDPCPSLQGEIEESLEDAFAQAQDEAVALVEGDNGPFDLYEDDERWFSFEVHARNRVVLDGGSESGDAYFELYDGEGELLFEADDEDGFDPVISEILDAGMYYLYVSVFEDTEGLVIEFQP